MTTTNVKIEMIVTLEVGMNAETEMQEIETSMIVSQAAKLIKRHFPTNSNIGTGSVINNVHTIIKS